MRKAVKLLLPFFALLLPCASAHGQPAPQRRQQSARCRAAALRYIHPSPDKKHLTEEQEYAYEYEQEKKYLRLCGNSDDALTKRVKESVRGYEANHTLASLLRAAGKAGSPESKDPNTYAAIAAAYEVRLEGKLRAKAEVGPVEPESAPALAEWAGKEADLLIDAYARAVAACGARADCQSAKADWTKRVTELYRSRHGGSDAGLRETIDGALGRPLPQPWLPWWLTDKR